MTAAAVRERLEGATAAGATVSKMSVGVCLRHHIKHWAHGGSTTLSNLTLLCRRHHRAVHEEGYQVERKADGTLRFTHPHGFVVPDVPPQPEVPVDPAEALRAQNEARGVAINMQTPMVPT
jgi:HNH endonuclease